MDLTQVEKEVEAGGGYAAISVKDLRNAVGYTRAKVNVVAEISAGLQAGGFGHVPLAIPKQQDRMVLVYKQGAGTGAAILALIEAAEGGGQKGDGGAWGLATLLPKLEVK
jgi:hypothetical protein